MSKVQNVAEMAFCLIGYTVVIYALLQLLMLAGGRVLEKLRGRPSSHSLPRLPAVSNGAAAALVFVAFLLCWLPYFLLLHPGVLTVDSVHQVNQGLGLEPLKDHHPIVYSLILGFLVSVGEELLGSIYAGTCVAAAVQLVFVAGLLSFCVTIKIGPCGRMPLVVFFALNPLVAWYSVTLWKDVVYSFFLLVFGLSLLRLGRPDLSPKGSLALLVASAIGVLLFKKTGIYVLVIALCAAAIWLARRRRSVLAVLVCVVVLNAAITGPLMEMLHVDRGRESEAYSVPLQQIARVVAEHGGDLTSEEILLIDEVLPYDDLPALYNPKISDKVKGQFDEEAFRKDRMRFIRLYLSLGARFPGTYLNAFLSGTVGYWYPETKNWMVATTDYLDMLHQNEERGAAVYDAGLDRYEPLGDAEAKGGALEWISLLRKAPVLSAFFSIGLWVWAYLVLLSVCLRYKLKGLYPFFALVGAIWLTCMISPVYAEMRYAYALLLLLPFAVDAVLDSLSAEGCSTEGDGGHSAREGA